MAKALHSTVEMGDKDFRDLLAKIFHEMPSYHLSALIEIAKKKERRQNNMERLSGMLGGVL